jgi:hypothetical protein
MAAGRHGSGGRGVAADWVAAHASNGAARDGVRKFNNGFCRMVTGAFIE